MIQPASLNAVALGMALNASYVALGYLSLDRRPRGSRTAEIEPLGHPWPVVEIQPSRFRSAVDTTVFALVGVQPFAALGHIAIGVNFVRRWIRTITRRLSLLVPLPSLRRVVDLAASHRGILALDYWGDESLGTAQMPEAVQT